MKHKILLIILTAIMLSGYSIRPVGCPGYQFRVLPNGAHQVRNLSDVAYPSQVGRVFHNEQLAGTMIFPRLAAHTTDWQGVGFAGPLPFSGSWYIQGQVCSGSGMTK